jgi:hypothetical protein
MTTRFRAAVVAAGAVLTLTLAACGANGSGGDAGAMSVSVTEPARDATVSVPFTVNVASSVPLGRTQTGRHHVHIWFDGNANSYQVVETPTVQITELAPGRHVMHVSLRNANHSAAGAETEVPITVGGPGGASAPAATQSDQPYGY